MDITSKILSSAVKFALDKAFNTTAKYLKQQKLAINATNRDIESSISEHMKRLTNWSDEIKFKDISKAKKTSDIFIDVDIYLMPIKDSIDDEEKKKISSNKLFDEVTKHIVILGQPGAGKTTLMKHICQSILLDGDYHASDFHIPLVIRLRELNSKNRSDDNIIINTLFQELGLSISSTSVDKLRDEEVNLARERVLIPILEGLKAVIILDGYDEVANGKLKDNVIEGYKRLALALNEAKIILTSRSSDFNYSLDNIEVLEICPLSRTQIQEFVKKWLTEDLVASEFITGLENSPFADTAIRPLTLAHLCAIFERSGRIPDKPKTVYKKIVNLLLEEWDEQRMIRRGSKYSNFEVDRKFEFLCNLAYVLTIFFKKTSFTDSDLKRAYSEIHYEFDLEEKEADYVANEIETHTGLIIKSGYKEYEFAHKSIQEYLCSEYLVKLPSIPEFEILVYIPNELAIAVTISSSSSDYFCELVFNYLNRSLYILKKDYRRDYHFLTNFINRLVLEKPDFNTSEYVGIALVVLYSYFITGVSSQLRLFRDDLPEQFENLIRIVFKRNNSISILDYYEKIGEVTTFDDNIISMKRKLDIFLTRYRLPEVIYVKDSFLSYPYTKERQQDDNPFIL